jgi:hypothetical protein
VYDDTAPEEIERYHAFLRALPPHERLRIADGLCTSVRQLAEAGIRLRHPRASDEEVAVRLAVRLYGREAAMRVFGAVPDDAV